MAFSFNPTQQPPQAANTQPQGQVGFSAAGAGIQPAGTPTVESFPDSPFLFLHDRDKPISIQAYIQIMLILITVLTVIISLIIVSYSFYLKSSIDGKKEELAQKEQVIKTYPYDEMKKISSRYAAFGSLMKNYVSMRSPLKFLEYVVENQVEIIDFSVNTSPRDGGYSMTFTAATGNYKALLQQLEALNLTDFEKIIKNPKLGDFRDNINDLQLKVTTRVQGQGKTVDEVEKTFSEKAVMGGKDIKMLEPVSTSTP